MRATAKSRSAKPAKVKDAHKEKPTLRKAPDQKRVAVSALLTFYRNLRDLSRQQVAQTASISVSLLGMVENGSRLPSQHVLESLGNALQLSSYQRLQLHAIAGYSAQLPEAPGWEVRPEDLIKGVPLFLRNMEIEVDFQRRMDIEESWVVTRRPLALDEPVLAMLKDKLLNTDANYVYFVDARSGERDFGTLWHRLGLESNPQWQQKKKRRQAEQKPEQLAFVLSPPTLCASTHTIALFNPRSMTKPRFGRAAYYGGGTPVGVYPLDLVLYEQLVSLLSEIYVDCANQPGQSFPKDSGTWGTFRLLDLEALKRASIG